MTFSVIFSAALRASGRSGASAAALAAVTPARIAASGASATEFNGWLSFDPSRYKAFAFVINCQLSQYARFTSSTVASCGMLIVFEIATLMNGWAAAIIRTWDSHDRNRLPSLPHLL